MAQPSANEQYMLEMVNRARLNPSAEGNMFGVSDLNQGLPAGTISTDPKQPLAFNELLIESSKSHSQWMIDTNAFSHTGVNGTNSHERMENAGYQFSGSAGSGENIGRQGTTGTVNATIFTEDKHEDLFISSGHRKNILKPDYREIGIAATEGQYTKNGTTFNGLIVTQNFAYSGSDLFLTGVAYDDLITEDDFYTVGEGLADIDITATNTSSGISYSTTTMTAGGYQIALPSGTYDVNFSDNGQQLGNTEQITIGSENIKLDLNTDNIVIVDLSGNDTVQGDSGNNILYGETGNDRLYGYNGDDYLDGGADDDSLYGHDGDDTLIGGAGSDRIIENTDSDFTLTDSQLIGRGTDSLSEIELARIQGGVSNNLIDAGNVTQLNVTLDGAGGDDTLIGGTDNDKLLGRGGNDTIKGGSGDDILSGHDGDDIFLGGAGTDRILENADTDFMLTDSQLIGRGTDSLSQIEIVRIYGGAGDNLIDAGDVTQLTAILDGSSGNDTLIGGTNNDLLFGKNNDDSLDGNQGNDKLNSGSGNDILLGGSGNDTLFGGTGNDTLFGGTGDDILISNSGADVLALESNSGKIVIQDFDEVSDLFGLTNSLGFSDLSIMNNDLGTATIIRDLTNSNAVLAVVNNVSAGDVTAANFVSI